MPDPRSRERMTEAPFVAAFRQDPRFVTDSVTHNDGSEDAIVPGVVVTAELGEERLDANGDGWDLDLTITARRPSAEGEALDEDAAAIQRVLTTSNSLVGSPGITYMQAEEDMTSARGTEGKARTYSVTVPLLVVFS